MVLSESLFLSATDAGRRAISGRALQPHHHARVRSTPAQGHPEYVERISI